MLDDTLCRKVCIACKYVASIEEDEYIHMFDFNLLMQEKVGLQGPKLKH